MTFVVERRSRAPAAFAAAGVPAAPARRSYAAPAAQPRSYADRADALVGLVNGIRARGDNPHHIHETRDAAAREMAALARALRADGL